MEQVPPRETALPPLPEVGIFQSQLVADAAAEYWHDEQLVDPGDALLKLLDKAEPEVLLNYARAMEADYPDMEEDGRHRQPLWHAEEHSLRFEGDRIVAVVGDRQTIIEYACRHHVMDSFLDDFDDQMSVVLEGESEDDLGPRILNSEISRRRTAGARRDLRRHD